MSLRRFIGLAVLLVACDRVYADPITRSSATSGVDASLSTPRAPPYSCLRRPVENAPCERVGAVCEVGSSSDPDCNRRYVCHGDPVYGAYWTEDRPPRCLGACPAPAAIVDGAPCVIDADGGAGELPEAELHCTTPAGTCACTTGPDGARAHPRRWVCRAPGAECPERRPGVGQPCVGSRSCDYGACDFKRGARMLCESDVWQIEAASCP